MSTLVLLFLACIVVGGIFLAWMYTKPGKRWLGSL